MHKIIFVDDEAIVRDGISNCIPWVDNGFDLVCVFEHGLQVLDYLESNHVDVIISDINMPRMDGLALSRILSEKYPDIMLLLLTGYDDFEYAQEAVKTNVREFLLKPITAEELIQVLARVRTELDSNLEKENQTTIMRDKLRLSFPLLKERFLYRLVSGKLDKLSINQRKEYFEWQDLGRFYLVSLVLVPDTWNELDRLTLFEFIKTRKKTEDDIFSNREENIVILFQGDSIETLELRSRNLAEMSFQFNPGSEKDQISVGCGEAVSSLDHLLGSYNGAGNAVNYSRVLGLSQILSIKEVRGRGKIAPEKIDELGRMLSDQLKTGRKEHTEEALLNIFVYLEELYITPVEAYHYFTRIHLLFLSFVQEMELFSGENDSFPYQPRNFDSFKYARDFFLELISIIEERVQVFRNDAVLSRVEKARRIIKERLSDSAFSLQDICNELYLSVSQFSVIFKEGTGQTFIEYLTSCRVEEAKKILKTTDSKSYEVAEKSGYMDPRYFSIIFKKATGMTPMEYRRSLSG
ncbi:MAG: response regulator [Spirochaetia bacterium]|jgi:two-component system response regulator YesN|nr:response regulator [Spirochaetia bacterium]